MKKKRLATKARNGSVSIRSDICDELD